VNDGLIYHISEVIEHLFFQFFFRLQANRDGSKAVTSAEIYQLFDNLNKKRRRQM